MKIVFQGLGWKSKVSQKRSTLNISINKLIVIGCDLEKGQTLYSYLAKDDSKRAVMITYLDGDKK